MEISKLPAAILVPNKDLALEWQKKIILVDLNKIIQDSSFNKNERSCR